MTSQRPRIGVSIVVRDEQGRVLLGLRKGSHGAGTWGLPGGALEPGEDPILAARRELGEETGLHPKVVLRHEVPYVSTVFEDGQHWITLIFEAEHCGEPDVMEPEKCEQWGWFDVGSLPSPLFPTIGNGAVLQGRPLSLRVFKISAGADYWVAAKDEAHALGLLAEMVSSEGWTEEFMEQVADGVEATELRRETWSTATLHDDGTGRKMPLSHFISGYGVFGCSEWP